MRNAPIRESRSRFLRRGELATEARQCSACTRFSGWSLHVQLGEVSMSRLCQAMATRSRPTASRGGTFDLYRHQDDQDDTYSVMLSIPSASSCSPSSSANRKTLNASPKPTATRVHPRSHTHPFPHSTCTPGRPSCGHLSLLFFQVFVSSRCTPSPARHWLILFRPAPSPQPLRPASPSLSR